MKYRFLPLVFLAFGVHAQTINSPNIPQWGMTMNFDQFNDTVSVSASGPWDFSSVQPASTYTMAMLPISASSNASNYPDATHVLQSANGEFFFTYDSVGLKTYGKVTSSTTASYATPLTMVPFPLDASTTHVDSIASTLVWNGLTANVTDKAEVQGIASGAVTMPDGVSYQNAVVLSTKRTTVTGPSPFGTYLTVVEHSKIFWLPNYPLPVVEVLHVFSNGSLVFKRSLFLQEFTSFGNEEVLGSSVSVYPNPVLNELHIQTNKPSELRICDALGREVYKKDAAGSLLVQVIDMSGFAPGHYFLSIDNGDGVIWRKVIKE